MLPSNNYTVIDGYFKPWIVDAVSGYYEHYPVTFSNSSKATYKEGSRFFGTIIMEHETWKVPQELNSWFNHLLRGSIINDILKDKVSQCDRILVNGQVSGLKGVDHTDHDAPNEKITVIYMAHGNSGSTRVGDEEIPFKEGRIVMFDSNKIHRGDAPNSGYRVSLGCVFS